MPYEDNSVNLFLDGVRVNGLEDITVTTSPISETIDYIGNEGSQNIRSAYENTKLSISKKYYGPDGFINRFSGSLVNGYITVNNQTGNNIAFTSGCLTNYSILFGINQQPSISCDFEFYNQCGQLNITGQPFVVNNSGFFYLNSAAPEDYYYSTMAVIQTGNKRIYRYNDNPLNYFQTGDDIYFSGEYVNNIALISNTVSTGHTGYIYRKERLPIVSSKGIKLDIDDARNNNLIQASINYSFPKLPIYNIGNKYPSKIFHLTPSEVICTLDFEPDNYQLFNQNSWPNSAKRNNLNFRLFDKSGNFVDAVNLGAMELISEKSSVNMDGTLRISAEYKKYLSVESTDSSFDISSLGNQVYFWLDANEIPNVTYSPSEFPVHILYDKGVRQMNFTGTYGDVNVSASTKNGKRYITPNYDSRGYGNNRLTYNPTYNEDSVEWAVTVSGIECIFVGRFTGSTSSSTQSYLAGSGPFNYLYYGTNFSTQTFQGNIGRYFGTSSVINGSSSGIYTDWQIFGIRRGGGSPVPNTGMWNGYSFGAYTNSISTYDNFNGMQLFGNPTMFTASWNGDIGEIIWMAPQTESTRNQIIKHLANKWGLSAQINPNI